MNRQFKTIRLQKLTSMRRGAENQTSLHPSYTGKNGKAGQSPALGGTWGHGSLLLGRCRLGGHSVWRRLVKWNTSVSCDPAAPLLITAQNLSRAGPGRRAAD